MKVEFRMPDVGEGIAEVELLEWHVQVGAQVHEFDTIATLQTDKSVLEMPSPVTGTVIMLGAKEGDILPVGSVLIAFDNLVRGAAPAQPEGADAAPDVAATPPPAAAEHGSLFAAEAAAAPRRPKAAPVVRKLATGLGVDLADIEGTGPGGRITRDDVQRAAAAFSALAEDVTTAQAGRVRPGPGRSAPAQALDHDATADEHVPLRGLRRQIARKMVESWRSVPHITDWREADATMLIEARRELRAYLPASDGALTYMPFFVKITATALRHHPLLNASFDEDAEEYVLHRRINIGLATATASGLLVPVVRDADRKSISELAAEIAELVAATRDRKATLEQLSGGTYTVNNLGAIGGHMGTPIIRTPEVGILGFGRISEHVIAVNGSAVIRPTIMLSSVGDHRLHDGDTLGAFTSAVVYLIEHPFAMLGELR